MKSKKVCFTELAYVFGIITLALGTALMEKADFGMSMVVAPAYLLHLKISQYLPFYTFGVSEYIFQAVLLILLTVVMRKFKKSYIFSFVTAVIYGFTLDFAMFLVGVIQFDGMGWRCTFYSVGMLLCAIGVAFFFHTYIAPEAYELLVKEISTKYNIKIDKVKTVYDCSSCLLAILFSFLFFGFGHFEGVKVGTIIGTLVNGWLIGRMSKLQDSLFVFKDALKLREKFNK